MSSEEIVRSWKDPERRGGGQYADHPAGEIALDRAGGSDPFGTFTVLCCTVDAVWCPPQSHYVLQCPILD